MKLREWFHTLTGFWFYRPIEETPRTDLRHIGLMEEVERQRAIGDNIREQAIKLNEAMAELYSKLGISDRLQLINVGEVPGDCTGDPIGKALSKMAQNVRNVTDALE